jgi:diguanylate cyclase (GGDEF)-like protein
VPRSPEFLAVERLAGMAESVLAALRERLGLEAWVLAAPVGEDWTPLLVLSPERGGERAAAFPWPALCRRVAREGAAVVPRAGAELGGERVGHAVGAYAGMPVRLADGRIVAAVCGADETPRPPRFAEEVGLIRLTGELLSALAEAERTAIVEAWRAEHAEAASRRDSLTGLGNRRLWDRLLVKEEERCRRQGLQAAVVVIDLDALKQVNDELGHAAGDDLLKLTAAVLSTHTRKPDYVARIGGDEFAIVATDCGPDDLAVLVARLREALAEAGVHASIGAANRTPESGLPGAWAAADQAMYREKRDRRSDPRG